MCLRCFDCFDIRCIINILILARLMLQRFGASEWSLVRYVRTKGIYGFSGTILYEVLFVFIEMRYVKLKRGVCDV